MSVLYWKVKALPLTGTSYAELKKKANEVFSLIGRKSKRKPYIRSKFFKKRKVFFDYFWDHMFQKPKGQRVPRLKLLTSAIELIEQCTFVPTKKSNPNKTTEFLYRFYGVTPQKEKFVVQIKDSGKSLQLLSVFPWK